jgi:translation initiation factor IF-3
MPTRKALDLAEDQGLDLVLIAEKAQPPVVRIIDHGRWKYEQSKAKKESKKKVQEVKGINMRPATGEHDLQIIIKKAIKFLQDGDKVRLVCRFRQRELAHPKVGETKLRHIMQALEEFGKTERDPILGGREMVLVISPRPQAPPPGGAKKNVEAENPPDSSEEV